MFTWARLSQLNPVHILTSYRFKIRITVMVPSTSRSFRSSLSFGFSDYIFVWIYLPNTWHMPVSSHPPWFDLAKSICWLQSVAYLIITVSCSLLSLRPPAACCHRRSNVERNSLWSLVPAATAAGAVTACLSQSVATLLCSEASRSGTTRKMSSWMVWWDVRIGVIWLGVGSLAGYCEQGNELSRSIKGNQRLD
jgi:hypothetical protein